MSNDNIPEDVLSEVAAERQRRNLVKAAALILAEIERLDRVAGKIAGPGSMQVQHPSPCWCPYCGDPHSPAVREQK